MTTLPRGREFTRADLETMPDDGCRYELIDGALLVTPAPVRPHQRAVVRLTQILTAACPAHLEVLVAPFDVALDRRSLVQPDLLVVPWSDADDRDVTEPPLLVVEVLSPSTRRVDLTLKRSKYGSAGCPSYWVVDLDEPSVIVWELEDGKYAERAHCGGRRRADRQRAVRGDLRAGPAGRLTPIAGPPGTPRRSRS